MFKSGISLQQQKSVLQEIDEWKDVDKILYLLPNSDHPDIRRMVNTYVNDEADIDEVVQQLEQLPEIESASVPPQRGLVR
jgi:hypothetical protein